MVDSYAGADAVLKRCTIGGFSDGSVSGAASWGILTWQLATLTVEDCLIEDAELIGISACHASTVSVLGCTVQGCRVGGLLVNEEAQMTVQSCLLRDNMAALVAGTEAFLASMELVGNVVHNQRTGLPGQRAHLRCGRLYPVLQTEDLQNSSHVGPHIGWAAGRSKGC